jgi:hypothetical protein
MAEGLSIREMNVMREALWHVVQRGDISDADREVAHDLYSRFSGGLVPNLFKDQTAKLHFHLVRAENHAQSALDLLYGKDAVKRSIWFRMAIGRAQSILMSAYIRDAKLNR